jgi:hypothetical protein
LEAFAEPEVAGRGVVGWRQEFGQALDVRRVVIVDGAGYG